MPRFRLISHLLQTRSAAKSAAAADAYVAPCLPTSQRWCVNAVDSPAPVYSCRGSKRWFCPFPSRKIKISFWTDAHPPDVFDTQIIERVKEIKRLDPLLTNLIRSAMSLTLILKSFPSFRSDGFSLPEISLPRSTTRVTRAPSPRPPSPRRRRRLPRRPSPPSPPRKTMVANGKYHRRIYTENITNDVLHFLRSFSESNVWKRISIVGALVCGLSSRSHYFILSYPITLDILISHAQSHTIDATHIH